MEDLKNYLGISNLEWTQKFNNFWDKYKQNLLAQSKELQWKNQHKLMHRKDSLDLLLKRICFNQTVREVLTEMIYSLILK